MEYKDDARRRKEALYRAVEKTMFPHIQEIREEREREELEKRKQEIEREEKRQKELNRLMEKLSAQIQSKTEKKDPALIAKEEAIRRMARSMSGVETDPRNEEK